MDSRYMYKNPSEYIFMFCPTSDFFYLQGCTTRLCDFAVLLVLIYAAHYVQLLQEN